MLYLLFIFEIILLIISYFISSRKFSSPSVLVNASFVFSTAFLLINKSKWALDIGFNTFFLVIIGNILFLVGEIIAKIIQLKKKNYIFSENNNNVTISTQYTGIILAFEIIAIILVYSYIKNNVAISYDYKGVAMTLMGSYRHQQEEYNATWVTALISFGKVLMYFYGFIVIYRIIYENNFKLKETLAFVAAIVLCSLSSARIDIILMAGSVIVWIYALLWKKYKNINEISKKMIKWALLIVVLMFVLFFVMGMMTGKTGSTVSAIVNIITVYAGGGTIGLDKYLTSYHGAEFTKSSETLYGLNSILVKLGHAPICHYRNLEFFFMGKSKIYTGNTYTVYRRLLHDYGLAWTMVIRVLEGYIMGKIYYKIYDEKNMLHFLRYLLISGTVVGVLITEAVDTLFLIILPTFSEILMLILLSMLFSLYTKYTVVIEKRAKIRIRRKDI